MYTKEQLDAVLSEVEQELSKTLEDVAKSENIEEDEQSEENEIAQDLSKSEENSEDMEYSEEDHQAIDEIYSSMNKSEKEAHYASIKKFLFDEAQEEVKMSKSEPKTEIESISKSEFDTVKSENEQLKKNIEDMNKQLEKLFSVGKKAPAQKAITNIEFVAKSEESKETIDLSKLSKNEITSKLKTLDYEDLSKSDRTAINEFYLNNGSVEKIKHLIKE